LHYNPAGQLAEVVMPEVVPTGLEPGHLRDIIAQLKQMPLAEPEGGPFTQKVWKKLAGIRWGTAKTYLEIATALGNPKASRAVGNACGTNRLLLVIPCHRVIASAGMGGFRAGLEWKAKLLELESESEQVVTAL